MLRTLSVLVVALSIGCGGGIRVIVRDDEGGLLELEGDDGEAHRDAEEHMRAHCGEYRVVFDGTSSVPVDDGHAPSAGESARRMALTSDLPGVLEPAGTESTGGSVDESGEIHLAGPTDGARESRTRYDSRRRIEYECEREIEDIDEEAPEDGAGAEDSAGSEPAPAGGSPP